MCDWLKRGRRWWYAAIALVLVAVGGGAWWWLDASPEPETLERTITVNKEHPVEIDTTLYIPATKPAPAVMLAHGFGGSKDTQVERAEQLAAQGYTVLTYTARGFGESGGQIHLNQPDYEIADASGLLDYLAKQEAVVSDHTGDPRVAVVGGSYGGALSLLLAGQDNRVDTIVPQVTWNRLSTALFPNGNNTSGEGGVFKRTWTSMFFNGGLNPGQPTGPVAKGTEVANRGDPACGRWAPEACEVFQRIAETKQLDDEAEGMLDKASPASILDKVSAPALMIQGQADTLFGLEQANANAAGLKRAPVKMAWFSGGHDAPGGASDQARMDSMLSGWLDHYLGKGGAKPDNSFTFSRVAGASADRSERATVGMNASQYPGMSSDPANRRLKTPGPQTIASPADGTPAAMSSVPNMGQLTQTPGMGLVREVPGQFTAADTEPLSQQVDVVGSPKVKLRAASPTGEAVLFLKMYDVDNTGKATLPNGLLTPVHLKNLPTDISDAKEVTVDLPGVVHRMEAGHHLRVVAATSDQAYAGPSKASEYTVELSDQVALPQVAAEAQASDEAIWGYALVGLAIVIPVGALVAWIVARMRHRRRDHSLDEATADTPLVIRGLCKRYRDGFVAVDGVDLTVQRGQVVGLLGPNGAGKTTTLRVLMGLLRPTGGELRVFGHRVTPGAPVLSRLGALVEGPGLLPHLSGMDNLRLYWKSTGRPESEAHLDEVVRIADLGERVHRKVRTYSHGMKQRIAIAQAMLGLPELLVLDEPTDGLDPPQIAEMRRVLHEYASGGRAVLVSSHLLAEVEQTCTHVAVMSRGKVVAAGEVSDIIGGNGDRLEDAFLELVE